MLLQQTNRHFAFIQLQVTSSEICIDTYFKLDNEN
jgi:hypothetical protein